MNTRLTFLISERSSSMTNQHLNHQHQLYSFGSNSQGQLSLGNQIDKSSPEPCLLSEPPRGAPRCITGGGPHAILITSTGDVLGCGLNDQNQLGDLAPNEKSSSGSGSSSSVERSKEKSNTAASTAVLETRNQDDPNLDNCETFERSRSQFTPLRWLPNAGKTSYVTAACGWAHTLILDEDGKVFSCGDDTYGQLGRITATTDTNTAKDENPQISNYLVEFLDDRNDRDNGEGGVVRIRDVAAGLRHSVAVDTLGRVWVWGFGKFGQLGIGNGNGDEGGGDDDDERRVGGSKAVAKDAATREEEEREKRTRRRKEGRRKVFPSFDRPRCLTTFAERNKIHTFPRIARVACGAHHTAFLSTDGQLFTCGTNRHGQLGHSFSSQDAEEEGTQESLSENKSFLVRRVSDLLPSSSPITDVRCGWGHTTARLSNGEVWSWGRNDKGQLGRPSSSPSPSPSSSTSKPSSAALPSAAATFCPIPSIVRFPVDPDASSSESSSSAVRNIVCGSEHTIAMFEDGRCAAWGWNEHGNCGTGDTADVLLPRFLDVDRGGESESGGDDGDDDGGGGGGGRNVRKVVSIGSGYGHSFICT